MRDEEPVGFRREAAEIHLRTGWPPTARNSGCINGARVSEEIAACRMPFAFELPGVRMIVSGLRMLCEISRRAMHAFPSC